MCIMYFYIFCSQTAVSWKLWFTREAAFTQWHVAGRDVLWWMVPLKIMELLLEAWQFWGEGVFYLISILNVWSACLSSPQTTCLAVLRCLCGMELRCNHTSFPCGVDPCDVTALRQEEFCPFATEIQRGSFPCGGMAIGKHCVCKSFCLTLCFFSWLCVRLASRTYGEVLLFSS